MVALGLPGAWGLSPVEAGPRCGASSRRRLHREAQPRLPGTSRSVPSSTRGPDKMEDVVSSSSLDGSGGRLPTGLRGREALPALGARGSPPPAFQTPARPGLTGLPDIGQGGRVGHRGRGASSRCEGRWPSSGLRAATARQPLATAASNSVSTLRRAGRRSRRKRRGVQWRRKGVANG